MNTRVDTASWIPSHQGWAALSVMMVAGLLDNWAVAVGLLVLVLVQAARPFDFILAFLVVVAGASWVSNTGGQLTFELSLLTVAVLLMLFCYMLSSLDQALSLPKTSLTRPLALFLALSIVNAARGYLAGYPSRYLGLEFIALLALGGALLVANAFEPRRDLRLAMLGLIAVGFATAVRGFFRYSIEPKHTSAAYIAAGPGIVGLLLVNMALRSKTRAAAFGWAALSLPLFLHQFITFGRGLWTGCIAGFAASILIFAGLGRRSGARWHRVGLVAATIVGLGLAGSLGMGIIFKQGDLLEEGRMRLASITSTKGKVGTYSNLIRLYEYTVVLGHIGRSPWVGYGVGFTFPVKQPFGGKRADQWGVHDNFLMVWLKQGVIGLTLFVWMLWTAIVISVRAARREEDPWKSTWFASTATATIFLAVFSLSNYPFAFVNETFMLALLWGGTMAMTRKGLITLRWSRPATGAGGRALGG